MNMKHFYSLFLIVGLFFTNPTVASADVSGLVPCKDSPVFKKRLDGSVKKLSARLQNYEPGSPAYLSLEQQIERTKARFAKYGEKGLLCGTDGLPHLIVDGRLDHAGEFMLPGVLFLYTTGWIGWAGRKYVQTVATTSNPMEKEIIIDVPLALKIMFSGYMWPVNSWKEAIEQGDFVASDEDITVSPR